MFDPNNKVDEETFKDNFGNWLYVIGVVGPRWYFVILLIILSHQTFLTLATTYFARNILSLAFESLNIFFMISTMLITIVVFRFSQDKFVEVLRVLGSQRHQYQADTKTLQYITKLRQESRVKKRYFPKVFSIGVMICIISFLFVRRPLDAYLNGKEQYLRNGDDLPNDNFVGGVPYPHWHYLNTKKDIFYYPAAAIEYVFIVYVGIIVFTTFSFSTCLCYEIFTEFEVLQYMLENLGNIAEYNHKKVKNDKINFSTTLKLNLKSCIVHHQNLIRCSDIIKDIMFVLLACYCVGVGGLTCILGTVIVAPTTSTGTKLTSSMTLSGELFFLATFCYYGERFKNVSLGVGESIYRSKWFKYYCIKNYVLIMLQRTLKPCTLSVGGFGDMDLKMFASIVQTSYSYFNMLVAVNEF